MSRYKDSQYLRQEELIKTSPNIFSGDKGNGFFMGKPRPFVLRNGVNNIYEPIRDKVIGYLRITESRGGEEVNHLDIHYHLK